MNNKEFITLDQYVKDKRLQEENKKIKEKENSLIEYQKSFNTGRIISKENKNNKFVFLKLEGNVSKFRKNWLVSIDDILELSQHSDVSTIGYTNKYIVGISNFKGNVCTIIDMSILLNNKKSTINSNSCVLLRKNNGIALLWPEIEISNMDLTKISIDEYKQDKFFEKVMFAKNYYIDEKGNLWNELNIDQLLQSKPIIDGSNLNGFV